MTTYSDTTKSFLNPNKTEPIGPQEHADTKATYVPRFAKSTAETLRSSNRRILVCGSPGTGKTTLSVSASALAGDSIPRKERITCDDVVLIQGDHEGVAGAWGAGFTPAYVYDLASEHTWASYQKRLIEALSDVRPLCGSVVKYIVIDLALPNNLIQESVDPSVQKDWKLVAKLGSEFFAAFGGLPGVTVIGNAQLKAAAGIAESAQAVDTSNARAVGGERSTFMSDLYKGVGAVWVNHASLQITREVKRKKGADGLVTPIYFSHTQSNHKFEAKSRFRQTLKPTEDGSRTLHSILKQAYGDNL